MKRILYIHQYFKTPKEPGGTRSYWLAQELIKNNYEVTVLATSTTQVEKIKKYEADGIKVISYKVDYNQSMGVIARLKSFTGFMFQTIKYSFQNADFYDFTIATSTPLTVGVAPLLMKLFKNKKYIFEVRDLWPEVPIQMGALKNPLIIKLTRYLEQVIYKNAEHVIALSPGMRDGVIKYVSKEKTSMIPNMSKKDEFWPREKNAELLKKLGLSETSFKVIHFGSLGLANGADTIIESLKLMKNDIGVEFLFVGGGSTEEQLKLKCKDSNLTNAKFLGRFPMHEMSEIVNLCDVSIVSFMDLPILYTNSPNKLFDSLSAGKPIIVNSAGWTKDLVEENNCGFYVNPKNPEELVKKIGELRARPDLVKNMGANSRLLAENKYDKSILCKEFVQIINNQNV